MTRDPLLGGSTRQRRRHHPLWVIPLALAGLAAIAALWIWVFTPLFMTPREFHDRQRRFELALRDVLRVRAGKVPTLPPWPGPLSAERLRFLACTESQVARDIHFLPGFTPVSYPWGSPPAHLGSSADLLTRCLRDLNLDLQQLIHLDRQKNPKRYPTRLQAGTKPDRGRDHRRVPVVFTFAQAFFPPAPLEHNTPELAATWLPGDLVFWKKGTREGSPDLIGIVLDRRDPSGIPWVATLDASDGRISIEHRLDRWPILGHFQPEIDEILERFLEAYPGTQQEPRPP